MIAPKNRFSSWFRIASEVKKDGPFFFTIGLICGLVQIIGYRYFDKAEWGSKLLQEHIAFNSLTLMLMFLLLARILTDWLFPSTEMRRIDALKEHIAGRTIAFSSVAAFVLMGFAVTTAISGAYAHALQFGHIAIYFLAIAEVAANPLRKSEISKSYSAALGMVIVTPILMTQ